MLTLDKIYHAAFVLKDVIRETSMIQSKINPDCVTYLKPENLQITGSFKVRGAGYMISQLTEDEKARGVIACSAGNHAQGVALASSKYGIKAVLHNHLGTRVESQDELERFLTNCPDAGMVFDTGHLAGAGGNVIEITEKYSERIISLHVKDFVYKNKESSSTC